MAWLSDDNWYHLSGDKSRCIRHNFLYHGCLLCRWCLIPASLSMVALINFRSPSSKSFFKAVQKPVPKVMPKVGCAARKDGIVMCSCRCVAQCKMRTTPQAGVFLQPPVACFPIRSVICIHVARDNMATNTIRNFPGVTIAYYRLYHHNCFFADCSVNSRRHSHE